ncbi:hypothetical protein Taro_017973 [Colocasia esculenta]|uniref:Uncharacterized protein n=1 Tax=Colocasia esculenta TaxID=4460 RepID=A0A843USJ8_COLES|nr:hypothetical protein [Colocasia esculenta]
MFKTREGAKPTPPPSIPSSVRLRLSSPSFLLFPTLSRINFGFRDKNTIPAAPSLLLAFFFQFHRPVIAALCNNSPLFAPRMSFEKKLHPKVVPVKGRARSLHPHLLSPLQCDSGYPPLLFRCSPLCPASH